MNGVEAAAQIRARLGTPVIYLTAYADEAILQQAKATTPYGYIIKPFQDCELRSSIEVALCWREQEQKLQHAALHDALTGLPNRNLFMEYLESAVEQAQQDDAYAFALLFLDLDRFKAINDGFGHVVGDWLLTVIARRLERCVRPGDVVARIGGDEFAIVLDNVQGLDEARCVAGRIQNELTLPVSLNGHRLFASASIGIALNGGDERTYERPEYLLRDADAAMYRAKALGRARYAVFDEEEGLARVGCQ
jgi:diguanylate cyclase (GGDEF)-like protein